MTIHWSHWSNACADKKLDLGATWFWPGENRVASLVKELNISTHPHYIEGDAMYHVKGANQGSNASERLSGNPIDVRSSRFTHSAASLTDALAADLAPGTLHLNTAVRSITSSGEGAMVEFEGGSLSAQHVVLALPPALVMHAIEFDPPLPDAVVAVARRTPVWMGHVAKAVVVYDAPFWRSSGLAGSAVSHSGPLQEIHDMSGPDGSPAALFGFATARDLSKDAVREQMVEIFGPQAGDPKEIVVQNWGSEGFTSPPRVGGLRETELFGHHVYQKPCSHGRVHWVSTETARNSPGHIEGAIAAAHRAVRAIAS